MAAVAEVKGGLRRWLVGDENQASGIIGSTPPILLNKASNSDHVILPSPTISMIGNGGVFFRSGMVA